MLPSEGGIGTGEVDTVHTKYIQSTERSSANSWI